jgi:hypothetical protein
VTHPSSRDEDLSRPQAAAAKTTETLKRENLALKDKLEEVTMKVRSRRGGGWMPSWAAVGWSFDLWLFFVFWPLTFLCPLTSIRPPAFLWPFFVHWPQFVLWPFFDPQFMSSSESLATSEAEAEKEKSLLRQRLASTIPEDDYEKLRLRLLQVSSMIRGTMLKISIIDQ